MYKQIISFDQGIYQTRNNRLRSMFDHSGRQSHIPSLISKSYNILFKLIM